MNKLVVLLLTATLSLQAVILYQNYRQKLPPGGPVVRDAAPGTALDLADLPTKGSDTARVVLVEFSDFECPFCRRHAKDVAPALDDEFVAKGKVRRVFVNNPLPIHQNAKMLATAAICAGEQGQYWEMYTRLFEQQSTQKEDVLLSAQNLGINADEFKKCLEDSPEPAKRLEEDLSKAAKFHLAGTPSFAIGVIDKRGQLSIQKFITGAVSLNTFEKTINDVLSGTRS